MVMPINEAWDNLYNQYGEHVKLTEGDSAIYYRFPYFRDLFYKRIPALDNLRILEIGGGGGIFEIINSQSKDANASYVITEYSPSAVENMKKKFKNLNSLSIKIEDATNLSFDDNMFDVVYCLNVMHHVPDARMMAAEMMRVCKKYVFLCEPNGISLIRRLGELLPTARKLGEKSYSPWQYKQFFMNGGAKSVSIRPIYFFVPPNIRKEKLKPFIKISEIGEKIPLVRWQSQSLEIFCEK
jgi:ubiquinone/menaquinone biosynthesis C-methylase UbiE